MPTFHYRYYYFVSISFSWVLCKIFPGSLSFGFSERFFYEDHAGLTAIGLLTIGFDRKRWRSS